MNAACVLLLAALPAVDLPARAGDIEATLRLSIPDEGAGPGRSRVRIDIEITGPAGLEVHPPRLEDALSAWRTPMRGSSWRREGDRDRVDLTLVLEQTKPGVVGLPGVVVRARSGGEWQELSWADLLQEPREPAPPDWTPPLRPSPWPMRALWLGLAVAGTLGVVLVVLALRRESPVETPAHVRALARLEGEGLAPAEHLARLDRTVREYLDDRFGLNTRRRTSTEMAADCAALPEPARQAVLELSRLTELARFAGVAPSDDERLRAVALARQVIESCAAVPVGKEAAGGENEKNGGGG